MTSPNKIDIWKSELRIITSDITDTIENQHIFKSLVDIVAANPKINKPNLVWDHLRSNFGASLVLGISRQVDRNKKKVLSLLEFLEDIKVNAQIITRQWFVQQYVQSGLPASIGDSHFTEHFGSKSELDDVIVETDIQELKASTAKVLEFRHKRIAHKDADKKLIVDLNFTEVEAALKSVEKIIIKYQLLLNQAGYSQLLPTITYDWQDIFRTSWIPK
jgi:uncharacterized protein YdcH (DUF465 family)